MLSHAEMSGPGLIIKQYCLDFLEENSQFKKYIYIYIYICLYPVYVFVSVYVCIYVYIMIKLQVSLKTVGREINLARAANILKIN